MSQRSAWGQVARPLQGLPQDYARPWLTFLLVAHAALAVSGTRLLGREFPTDIALLYLLLLLIPLNMDDELKRELLRGTLREYALKFTMGFFVTLFLFWAVWLEVLGFPVGTIGYSAVWPMFVLQLVFVAPVEEVLFRAWMPRVIDPKGRTWVVYARITTAQIVLSPVAFSAFHYGAYGPGSWEPYVIVGLLAVVWTWAAQLQVGWPFNTNGVAPLGVPFTIGSHFAWNMCVMGILTGGVLAGT